MGRGVSIVPGSRRLPGLLIAAALAFVSTPALAQVDFTGHWNVRYWEDQEHRGPGGEMGDFTGIPLSAAGRARAETWDGAQYSQKEYQCRPHAANYMFRSVHPVRITEDIDPVTGETIAIHANFRDLLDRVSTSTVGLTPRKRRRTRGPDSPPARGKATRWSSPLRTSRTT